MIISRSLRMLTCADVHSSISSQSSLPFGRQDRHSATMDLSSNEDCMMDPIVEMKRQIGENEQHWFHAWWLHIVGWTRNTYKRDRFTSPLCHRFVRVADHELVAANLYTRRVHQATHECLQFTG
ncbi:hypothetical protein G7K_2768-t1 [Saitoella complicata NRRL Y-17804]|uniref:Uncharacterized protein n=1 Tax=Saitoella complicata (strain BCRC 22490 / CBS 7301 / JCM 7358 / NBRC 10748 / NRRL Y-17804) TaxID=698492 RepID=A0A0E9NFF7_SAICN|nr:hypothetical protein G7K_2768-t1 [Saitoella complicata NRRL Y-17804]